MKYLDLSVCIGSPPHAWHHSFTIYLGPEVIQGIFFHGKWGSGREGFLTKIHEDQKHGASKQGSRLQQLQMTLNCTGLWSVMDIKLHTVRANS